MANFANNDGTYRATVVDCGIGQATSGITQAVVRYALDERTEGGEWVDMRSEEREITGYHYFEKKDGTINEFTLNAFKDAFRWDGLDIFHLETITGAPCRVVVQWDHYQGQDRLKVQFVNPYEGGTGGAVQKADDATRRAIAGRLGSKLRAMSGPGNGSKAPAPPAPPKAPAPKGTESTQEVVWAALVARVGVEKADEEWFELLKAAANAQDAAAVTPVQWGVALDLAKDWESIPI